MKQFKLVVFIWIGMLIPYCMSGNSGQCKYTPWSRECRAQTHVEDKKSLMPGQNKDIFEPEGITAKDLTTVTPQVKLSGEYPLERRRYISLSRVWHKETTGWNCSCLVTDYFYPIVSVFVV